MTTVDPAPIVLDPDVEPALPLGPAGPEALTTDRLRVEVLLALEELLAGLVYDRDASPTIEAELETLTGWIVDRWKEGRRDVMGAAMADVEALELSQAAIVELSAAHATFVELAGQASRLEQVRAIVARGLTLTQSYDLANTLEAEVTALRGRLSGILGKYPELQQLMSDDVVARSAELQRADGSPIV